MQHDSGRGTRGAPDGPCSDAAVRVATDVLPNVRDLGGLPTEAGRRTRAGVLVRSAAPHRRDRAPESVPAWPPAEVVDLRSVTELSGGPHPLDGPGIRIHALPLLVGPLLERDGDWSALPDLASVYPEFLTAGAERLVRVLAVAARATGPVLVHCAAGKDRTGIAIAVLLRSAGVTREAIVDDYVQTERHLDAIFAREKRYTGPPDPTHAQKLMGAPAEAIAVVLDELDAVSDGAAGSQLRHGAEPGDLSAWRERLVA